MRTSALFLLVFGVAACGSESADSASSAWPGDDLATVENGRLVEEVRLGGLSGPEETTYGNVMAIRPIPGGGFHVVDGQIPVIRRYDAGGEHLGDLGRGGQGPGEYRFVTGLATLRDGRTLVMDGGQARVTIFDPEGEVERTFPLQSRAYGYDNRVDLETGDIYTIVGPEDGGFVEGPDVSIGDFARVDLDGNVERLLPSPPEGREGPRFVLSGAQGSYPFSTMTIAVMGAGGDYWESRNDADSIRHVHPDGTESWIRLEGDRVALTDEEYEQWRFRGEQMYERMANMDRPAGVPGPNRSEYVDIPRIKPYVREMVVDSDGRLWVLRYAEAIYVPYSEEEQAERDANGWPPHNWRDRLIWEVFDTDDRLLGRVQLPPKSGLYDAMGDDLYVLSLGDYREAYVHRYRVDLGADGG